MSKIIKTVLVILYTLGFIPFFGMLIWNNIITDIASVSEISFWQSVLVVLFLKLLQMKTFEINKD